MRKFVIFYEDGSAYEGGGEGDEEVEVIFKVSKDWLNAPVDGVQGVVYEEVNGTTKHCNGFEHVLMLPDGSDIYGTNDLGPFLRKYLKGIVKFGLCVSTSMYEQIETAMKDYNWQIYQEKIKPLRGIFNK